MFVLDALKFIGILFLVLLVFNFIILVHEWGHFLAARWRGLKIEKFQIWMGKCIWKRTWNGVQYGLGTIPIGGFVQLPQMSPMEAIEGRSDENREVLPPIKPLDKIIVAFAGPLFSFLLALAFACVVSFVGKVEHEGETNRTIGYLASGGAGEKSGLLKPGDVIEEIDGKEIKGFFRLTSSVVWAIASSSSDDINFKIRRPGVPDPLSITVTAPQKESPEYKRWESETSWFKKIFSRPPMRMVGIGPAVDLKVYDVEEYSPAWEAGMRSGDVILTINGEKCLNAQRVFDIADNKPDAPIELTVRRSDPATLWNRAFLLASDVPWALKYETGARELKITLTPRKPDLPKDAKKARTGLLLSPVGGDQVIYRKYPEISPISLVSDCFRNTAATLRALVTPNSSVGVSHMSGPVGIMNLYYNLFQNPEWWRLVLFFSVVLNVGLAIFNMMPLPVLDGGHITMAALEMVRGKAIGTRILEVVQLVCVLGLLSFVLFVTFKDVGGIVSSPEKEKFLPRSEAKP